MFWDQEILPLAQGVEPSSARGSQLIGTINICFANAIGGKEGLRAPEIQLTCKNRYCVKGILSLPSKYLERRSNKMNKQQSNILPCWPPEAAGKGCCPQRCDNSEQTSGRNLFPGESVFAFTVSSVKTHPGTSAALGPVSGILASWAPAPHPYNGDHSVSLVVAQGTGLSLHPCPPW